MNKGKFTSAGGKDGGDKPAATTATGTQGQGKAQAQAPRAPVPQGPAPPAPKMPGMMPLMTTPPGFPQQQPAKQMQPPVKKPAEEKE